jgi:hypothetical protein
MLQPHQIDELVCLVSALDRPALVEQFRNYRASFPIDFSRDFLERQNLERLRHLFLALCLQQQRMPDVATPEAA